MEKQSVETEPIELMRKAKEVIVYFDSCDIINCFEGNDDLLETVVFEAKVYNNIFIPFSSTHIKEVGSTRDKHFQIERLSYLAGFTTCLYLCDDIHGVSYRTANPYQVFKTINEVDMPMNIFQSLVPYERIEKIRTTTKFNPQYMNNILPENAVTEINEVLKKLAETFEDYTYVPVEGLIQQTKDINIENNQNLWKNMGADPQVLNSIHYDVNMLFSCFDSFGFWSDSKKVYEKGSRFGDAHHASLGVKANYLISSDKRFRMKTKAVYSFLNIKTTVLDANEGLALMNSLIQENKERET